VKSILNQPMLSQKQLLIAIDVGKYTQDEKGKEIQGI
jgi:hypothetical protein